MLKLSFAVLVLFSVSMVSFADDPQSPPPLAQGSRRTTDVVKEEWINTKTNKRLTPRQIELTRKLYEAIERDDKLSIRSLMREDNKYVAKRVGGPLFNVGPVTVFGTRVKNNSLISERNGAQINSFYVVKTQKGDGKREVEVVYPPFVIAIRKVMREEKFEGFYALGEQPDLELTWEIPVVDDLVNIENAFAGTVEDVLARKIFEGVAPRTTTLVAVNELFYATMGDEADPDRYRDAYEQGLSKVLGALDQYPCNLCDRDGNGRSAEEAYQFLLDSFKKPLSNAEKDQDEEVRSILRHGKRTFSDPARIEFRAQRLRGVEPPLMRQPRP
jgi:hypothetical protein